MPQFLSIFRRRVNSPKKEFITVRIVGGLGNQLFTLFFGLAVSTALGSKLLIDDKLVAFGSNSDRKIEILNLKFGKMQFQFTRSYFQPRALIKRNLIIRRIFWHLFNSQRYLVSEKMVANTNFKFKLRQTFLGYYQDWFYADYIYKTNGNLFIEVLNPTASYQKLRLELKNNQPICIHVRLGDYLDFPEIYSILPEHYYLDAIKYLNSSSELPIWVFIESKNELITHYPNLFALTDKVIDRGAEVSDSESFALLQESQSIVTSNSTYSLWAAWFAEKNGANVVVPLQMGVKGGQDDLTSARWDRYDLIRKEIIPKSNQEDNYVLKKREFESKFN
jgi:hypothetical protein